MSFLILAIILVGFIGHPLHAGYLNTPTCRNVWLSSSAVDQVKISSLWLEGRRMDTSTISKNHRTVRLLSDGENSSKAFGVGRRREGAWQ